MLTIVAIVVKATLLIGAYYLVPFDSHGRDDLVLRVVVAVVIIALALALAAKSIIDADFPLMRAADGVATLLQVMVVVFAAVYLLISASSQTSFSEQLDHTSALYFTVTTTTTIGYGDIAPASDAARVVVMIHMVINVLLVGIAARLLFQTARRRSEVT